MARPRIRSLAWHRAEALRRLGSGPVDTSAVAALLGAYAHANALLAERVRGLETLAAEVTRQTRTLADVAVGYRVLAARYAALAGRVGEAPGADFFPTLGKDGLVTVKGVPHLPDCARVPRPGIKRSRTLPCTCGSVVDAAKRRAPN